MTSTTSSTSLSRSDSPSSNVSSQENASFPLNYAQVSAKRRTCEGNERYRGRSVELEASFAKQREEQAKRSKSITDSTYPSPSPYSLPLLIHVIITELQR